MPVFISLALLFALAKDVVYFGAASDYLRIGSLGLAGAVGVVFALGALGTGMTRYLPMLLYCAWSLVPIAYADDVSYLGYQILSLFCVVAAGIGAFGTSQTKHERAFRALALAMTWSLAIAMALSIAGLWLWPAKVWEYPVGDVRRFRGLMSEPATLGVAAGLLVGFAWAVLRNPMLRYPVIALGVVSLALTGSRTPFIAMVLAALCVTVVHKSVRTILFAGTAAAALAGLVVLAGAQVDRATVERATRANSLTTMSGRFALWQYGWEAGRDQPVFGRGLTLGSEVLGSDGSIGGAGGGSLPGHERDGREVARATFHNGYLQAYMDSGLFGALLYLLVIGAATWQAMTSRKSIESGVILYVMVFLAVANLGQNAVQGPSTVAGVVFWLLAAAAASLPRKQT
jgi:O-antigen ligase